MSYASASASSLYRQTSTSSSSENLPPRTLARVARELHKLHKAPPEGVHLLVDHPSNNNDTSHDASSSSLLPTTSSQNLDQVLCEMVGPVGTPYQGKAFLLKLTFTQDFPSAPPRGFFLTKLYHPNVDPQTGAICVNTLKKDWTAETTLGHVLAVIRCLLIVPFPESSLNDEAGKLFMESYDEYAKRARLMAQVHGRTVAAGTTVVSDGSPNSKPSATTDSSNPDGPLSDIPNNSPTHNNHHHHENDSLIDMEQQEQDDPAKPGSAHHTTTPTPPTAVAAKALRNSDNNKKVTKAVHSSSSHHHHHNANAANANTTTQCRHPGTTKKAGSSKSIKKKSLKRL